MHIDWLYNICQRIFNTCNIIIKNSSSVNFRLELLTYVSYIVTDVQQNLSIPLDTRRTDMPVDVRLDSFSHGLSRRRTAKPPDVRLDIAMYAVHYTARPIDPMWGSTPTRSR